MKKLDAALKIFDVFHLAVDLWRDMPRGMAAADASVIDFYEKARDLGHLPAVARVQAASIEEVFNLTNTIDEPWYATGGPVKPLVPGGIRSTSVGDVVVVDGVAHRCASFGFVELPGLSLAAPEARAEDKRSLVIVREDYGVFLGTAMGMAFWSKMDPVGQDCAPVFPSREEALEFVKGWDLAGLDADGRQAFFETLNFVEVQADRDQGTYASLAACVKAGLEMWDPNEGMQQEAPVLN
jgi:hypothetical protein